MYGGSGNFGRGRGGGPVKRNFNSTFQPSSVQRPSSTPGGGRQSAGGGHRNRSITPTAAATVSAADETFSLVRNNPLNFGMIIRLSPVLVEEIKRLEAQGGAARMKFDPSANNPNGNVIDVGGKVFRFTWSQETGDLCDIYEECRNGENGDGLLVESGGAWRKLNVQRELDDSVKNHVKMRTVEAERKHKSRKAIILDHGNPSMKKQMQALAAAEVNNTWRGSYKQKKEPPVKKMKAETSSAVIPPKSGGKPGFSSSTPSKIRASASPLLSTPEQSAVQPSPLRNTNLSKLHVNREDATLTQSKENANEKETFNRVSAGIVQSKPGSNERFGSRPTDLQSLLISLLVEKPQGMNLKALEKAVGETIPKSVKQIEPILKKIAVFQAPGRYILKPDVELESFKKPFSESGSSPENNDLQSKATTVLESMLLKGDDVKEFEEPSHQISGPYGGFNTSERNDIDNLSSDILRDKKAPNNNEGPVASSSSSDSESDSSDSESDSRSPVGSRSGSSSESDSDASSNSKQGSDEDVDIMSDDDNEPKQTLQPLDHESGSPHNEKAEVHGSALLDLEKDLFGDDEDDDIHAFNKDEDNFAVDTTNLFDNHLDYQESEVHDHVNSVSRNAAKRGSDEKHFDENENTKRLKSGNWSRSSISRSPGGPRTMGRTIGAVPDSDFENANNREFLGDFTSDSPRFDPRSIDLNARARPPEVDNIVRFSGRDPQGNDAFCMHKDNKVNKDACDEDRQIKDRRPPKNSGGKHPGAHQKKHNALTGKNKIPELLSTSQIKDSPVDLKTSIITNGRGPVLQRELSDLEMGELRENWHEEKRFGRNNTFKQSENQSSSDYWNLDENKGKPVDLFNQPKKVVAEDHVDDFTRLNGKPSLSRVDHVKSGSQNNKGRHSEVGASQEIGIGSEGNLGVPGKHAKQAVPNSTKDKRRHKSKDLGERKKDILTVNSKDNNGQKRKEMDSCSDDSITSYTKYEKDAPEMKGPIRDLSQYNEYVQEYREKYDCYQTLNKILESYRNEFQSLGKDLDLAKGRDNERYNKILEQLMASYQRCGEKNQRLKKIFVVLHHELQHLKEMIRDFAEKHRKG